MNAQGAEAGVGQLGKSPKARLSLQQPPHVSPGGGGPLESEPQRLRHHILGLWGTSAQAAPVLVYTCCSQGQPCLRLLTSILFVFLEKIFSQETWIFYFSNKRFTH